MYLTRAEILLEMGKIKVHFHHSSAIIWIQKCSHIPKNHYVSREILFQLNIFCETIRNLIIQYEIHVKIFLDELEFLLQSWSLI